MIQTSVPKNFKQKSSFLSKFSFFSEIEEAVKRKSVSYADFIQDLSEESLEAPDLPVKPKIAEIPENEELSEIDEIPELEQLPIPKAETPKRTPRRRRQS